MTKTAYSSLLVFTLLLSCGSPPDASISDDGKEIDLLASGNLDDWNHVLVDSEVEQEDVWSFNNAGHLICRGTPLGYIGTKESYENFALSVEWKWSGKPGNSGVLMQIQSGEPLPTCIEAQLRYQSAGRLMGLRGVVLDGAGLELKQSPKIGTIHVVPGKQGFEHEAGEWNRYDITVSEGKIELFLNGEKVNEATLPDSQSGAIGFQSEGGVIVFRKILLTSFD
ncbi:MAG: DUF1080 domain-containing protein [Verrucomicrobiota bacterium]